MKIPLRALSRSFVLTVFLLGNLGIPAVRAQTTLNWRNDTSNGNWSEANWTDGTTARAPASKEILQLANTAQPAMVNNLVGAATNRYRMLFLPGCGTRTISGSTANTFLDYSSSAPIVENTSDDLQTLNFPVAIGYTFMEINPVNADIVFGGSSLDLNSNQLRIGGDNDKTLTIGAGTTIRGTGGSVSLNKNSKLVYNSVHTYTGETRVNAGTLVMNSGSSANGSTFRLGDTSGSAEAALVLASGANISSPINVRSGSSGAKTLGTSATTGSATLSGNITLDAGLIVTNAPGGTLVFSGTVFDLKNQTLTANSTGNITIAAALKNSAGAGGCIKTGAGTLVLTGATDNVACPLAVNSGIVLLAKDSSAVGSGIHAVNGALTVNSGATVRLGGTGGDQISNAAPVTISSGGVLDMAGFSETLGLLSGGGLVTNSGATATLTLGYDDTSGTFDGTLADGIGKIAVTKKGGGTNLISGANTYSGATAVNAGKLITTTSSTGAGSFTVVGNVRLEVRVLASGASLNMSSCALNTSCILDLNVGSLGNVTSPVINVTGAITAGTTVQLNLIGGNFSVGQFPLIKYGTLNDFSGFIISGGLPTGVSATLVHNTSSKTIYLNVTAITSRTWDGMSSAAWDIGSSANWKTTAIYNESSYGGNAVVFNDSLSSQQTNVALNTTVSPVSITVNCTSKPYTISGTGKISGYANITKTGTGILILSTTGGNDYAGVTAINNGIVEIRNGNSLGATNGGTTVSSGAVLQISGGITTAAEPLTLSGTGISSGGALRNVAGANVFTGPITLSGSAARINSDLGTLTLNSSSPIAGAGVDLSVGGSGTVNLLSGATAGTFTKDGAGSVSLAGNSSIAGTTLVAAGTLRFDGTNGGAGSLTVAAGSTLMGSGSNTGPVVVSGTIAPGASTGTFRSGAQRWNGGGQYSVEVSDATGGAGSGWDLLAISGGIDLQSSAGAPFGIRVLSLTNSGGGRAAHFNPDTRFAWTIASVTESVTNFDGARFALDSSSFSNDLAGGGFALETNSGGLNLFFTPNHPPVAADVTFTRAAGVSFKILISELLAAQTSDADGDGRELVAVGTAGNGAAVSQDGTWIYFTPGPGDADGAFSYTVRDARSYRSGDTVRTATGTITVAKVRAAGLTQTVSVANGRASMSFAGIPGYEYDVERSIDLESWSVIETVTTPEGGVFPFTDGNAPASAAYYRLRQH